MIYLVGVGNGRRNGRLRLTQSRRITECGHPSTISTITAGLERVVCESCGHVSVRYIEATVRIYPELDDLSAPDQHYEKPRIERPRINGCGWCSNPVEFMIPGGLACAEHAWKQASRQQVMGSEPWIPISIDQRTNAR